ncbi:MAG: transglycosylase SLT domain-containing protein [Parvibaculaceae bacterium]
MLVESTSANSATISGAIRKAAKATGASFDYLLATAQIESGLNPSVKARTSSATGLFQFIDQTWLETLKRAGGAFGYGRYAAAIGQNSSGRYYVRDQRLSVEIMDLRKDATANALMAGVFTRRNAARLGAKLGRAPTDGELYMAHFLGAGGAAKLITAAASRPDRAAADFLPRAAAANRSIFYRNGATLTAAQVYGKLAAKVVAARQALPPQIAEAAQTPAPVAPQMVAFAQPASPALAPLSAGPADIHARKPQAAYTVAGPPEPIFYGLFHTGERGPVSPLVTSLWGGEASVKGPVTGSPVADRDERHSRSAAAPVDVFGLLHAQQAWSRRS